MFISLGGACTLCMNPHLMRLESLEGVPGTHSKTLEAIEKAFEKAGIEFIGTPDSGAGVRWKV